MDGDDPPIQTIWGNIWKCKQMQPLWLCILSDKQFEPTQMEWWRPTHSDYFIPMLTPHAKSRIVLLLFTMMITITLQSFSWDRSCPHMNLLESADDLGLSGWLWLTFLRPLFSFAWSAKFAWPADLRLSGWLWLTRDEMRCNIYTFVST